MNIGNNNRTFAMIKPDATKRNIQNLILSDLVDDGFFPEEISERHLTKEEAEWLYRSSTEKSHFHNLVDYTTSGLVVLIVLRRSDDKDAVDRLRELIGPYKPEDRIPGTLRFKYGLDTSLENSIHGSDSSETASLEIQRFFGG